MSRCPRRAQVILIASGTPLRLRAFRFRHMIRPERSGVAQRSGLIIGVSDGSVRFQGPGTALGLAEAVFPAVPEVPETQQAYQPRKVR